MTCSACGHANQPEARFCERCGCDLGSRCSACGAEVRRGARFCSSCGQPLARPDGASAPGAAPRADQPPPLPDELADKISSSRDALAGERKQVTVLFCDVVGSMKLSETTDPEQWRAIMERFFAIVCESVHRYEGTVDKFTGDGAIALFGAPIAHEDHAARACHAALHLRDELAVLSAELRREHGINLSVRIGLNSGEVVVGSIGEDLAMDYTAIGHTVGLAQRMEALAEPGKAYLTEHTAHLVGGYFDLRDLGAFEIDGVGEPLGVYELAGLGRLRTRLEVSLAHGLARFVGREEETAALESALAHADEGNAQVICVVGEAGVGKSRLCYEFVERCRERGIDVWEGHCKARGETLPLLPLLELLRSYFGINDRDTGQIKREKIAGRVLLLDEDLRDELPLLFDLLGAADPDQPALRIDPEARQRRLFATLNRLLAARSERSTAVYLIEDLQWIDPGSAAFLENLIDALPGTRTLVIANFRPQYDAEWTGRSYCGRLALAPLGPEASGELLRELLGDHPSLDGLAERIRDRAGGNPFYIEELVYGLAEAGNLTGTRGAYRLAEPIDEDAIPATLKSLIEARIDRLPGRAKRLVQAAAVVGREFTESVLREVAGLPDLEIGAGVRTLLKSELISQSSNVPEPTYSFRHQLIEEVAYQSQLTEPRATLHGEVAGAIERLNPDRLDELAATISRHLEQAGEQLEAARWGARAAAWAGFADPIESLSHWRRVSELADSAPDDAEAVAMGTWARIYLMNVGWRLGIDEAEIRKAFEEAKALAERSGDPGALAGALGVYAHTRVMAGEAAEHVEMLLESARLADESGDTALRASFAGAPWGLFVTGRLRDALELMEPNFELWKENPSLGSGLVECPYAFCTWLKARARANLAQIDVSEAREGAERALMLAVEHADVENECWAHTTLVSLCWLEGSGEPALEHANRAVEIAERTGGSFLLGNAYGWRGIACSLCGRWREATSELQRAYEFMSESRPGPGVAFLQFTFGAEAYLGAGEHERAEAFARDSLDLAVRAGAFELEAQLALARVLVEVEGTAGGAEIEAALGRVESLIAETGAELYEPFVHEVRARLAEARGDVGTAERERVAARDLFEAIGAAPRAASLSERAPTTAHSSSPRISP